MKLQSILFPTNTFTLKQSLMWIRHHGYKEKFYKKKPEILGGYIRFRQLKPIDNIKYISKKLDSGIILILMEY